MRNLSRHSLLVIALACGLSVANAQKSATDTPGAAAGGQGGGVTTSQPGDTSATSPRTTSPTTATSGTSTTGASTQPQSQTQDGIVKYRGAVMFVKYGKPQPVKNEMKLSEGITVQPSGDVELKDGTKMTLQEGQMVTLDSQVTTIPPGMVNTLSTQGGAGSSTPSSPSTPESSGAGGGSTSTQPGAGGTSGGGSTPGAGGQPATSGAAGSTGGTTTGGAAAGGQ